MPTDLRQAAGFIAGFWLALYLLLPLVDGRQTDAPDASPPAVSAAE